jgi:hypothetical protein
MDIREFDRLLRVMLTRQFRREGGSFPSRLVFVKVEASSTLDLDFGGVDVESGWNEERTWRRGCVTPTASI